MATQVTRNLKEIREEIEKMNEKLKAAQPELKNINTALRLDSSNVDLLNQRFDNYGKQLEANRDKLTELKDRMAELNTTAEQNGGLTEAQQIRLQALQQEYQKTTAQVSGLESALKHQNETIDKAKFGDMTNKIHQAQAAISGFNTIANSSLDIIKNWEDMSGFERAVKVITLGLTAAATAAAILKSVINPAQAALIGVAAAAAVAGIAMAQTKAPKYADGGIVEDGLFQMNKGEVMGRFNDGTSFIANQQQQIDGLEEATYRGISRALAENGRMGGGVTTGVIEINGREFARATFDDFIQENLRRNRIL
jgi:phage-related tail protein